MVFWLWWEKSNYYVWVDIYIYIYSSLVHVNASNYSRVISDKTLRLGKNKLDSKREKGCKWICLKREKKIPKKMQANHRQWLLPISKYKELGMFRNSRLHLHPLYFSICESNFTRIIIVSILFSFLSKLFFSEENILFSYN